MHEDLFSSCDNSGGRQSSAGAAAQGYFWNPVSFYLSITPSLVVGLHVHREVREKGVGMSAGSAPDR